MFSLDQTYVESLRRSNPLDALVLQPRCNSTAATGLVEANALMPLRRAEPAFAAWKPKKSKKSHKGPNHKTCHVHGTLDLTRVGLYLRGSPEMHSIHTHSIVFGSVGNSRPVFVCHSENVKFPKPLKWKKASIYNLIKFTPILKQSF